MVRDTRQTIRRYYASFIAFIKREITWHSVLQSCLANTIMNYSHKIMHSYNWFRSGLGSVVGLLKTGSKNLFLFDEMGEHYQLQARCILDFYVHESRQRMGLGNILYQHMLSVSSKCIYFSSNIKLRLISSWKKIPYIIFYVIFKQLLTQLIVLLHKIVKFWRYRYF